MQAFELQRATHLQQALDGAANPPPAAPGSTPLRFLAGGTTLLDLMKLDVERPARVIDIHRLGLDRVETLDGGGVKIGATLRNADLANHPLIVSHYPVLSQALLSGASSCAIWRPRAAT
jgi:xanthine dehydrogenase YagS FAD-binding subunit